VVASLEVRVGPCGECEQEDAAAGGGERGGDVPGERARGEEGLERGEQRRGGGEERSVGGGERALERVGVGVGEEGAEVVDGSDEVVEVGAAELLDLGLPVTRRAAERGEQRLGVAERERTDGPRPPRWRSTTARGRPRTGRTRGACAASRSDVEASAAVAELVRELGGKKMFGYCKTKRNRWEVVGAGGVRWLQVGPVVAKHVGPACP
jgi:hypothetical protein